LDKGNAVATPPSEIVVLFEDNHCLAVNKPPGLATQAPPGFDSLEMRAKEYLRQRHGKQGRVYLGIPHRLDRPVSGIVLFARQTRSAQRLAEQFRLRQVTKIYRAAVEGDVQPAEGVWEDWLVKLPNEARAVAVPRETPGAKMAIVHYRRLAAVPDGTLLELRPETGRMHQLRVQFAVRKWPIWGDAFYGARLPFGPREGRDRVIALHAQSLTFLHPIRFEPISLVAPVPAWWRDWGIVETSPPNDPPK
jgi:23S rRNA pseudouridine1911/1915/1917 synthase